jgi:hypothetical protein
MSVLDVCLECALGRASGLRARASLNFSSFDLPDKWRGKDPDVELDRAEGREVADDWDDAVGEPGALIISLLSRLAMA